MVIRLILTRRRDGDVGSNEPTTKCESSSTRACQSNVKSGSHSNAENDAKCGKSVGSYL